MGSPFLLGTILHHWGSWLMVATVGLLLLAANTVILTWRVHAKTTELQQALADVQHSLMAQRKSEEALRESHELLLLFMRHSPVYAFIKQVTPTESRLLLTSDNFAQLIGRPITELNGKKMDDLFPPDFAAKITDDDWLVVSTGTVLKKDHELRGRYYSSITFPIEREGQRLLAGYVIDITDRKRAEAEQATMRA
jgi:PAS domain S-box-containing protein